MALELVPITLSDAKLFVDRVHRHHDSPIGGKFAVACAEGGEVVGVAIVGRPVSRIMDDGWTAEVTRLATTGARNACSMLYGTCWRAAKALGYRKLITYTLDTESGSSLKAAGWKIVAEVKGKTWHTPSRPRVDRIPIQGKLRWEAP